VKELLNSRALLTSASNSVGSLIRQQDPDHNLAANPDIVPAHPKWRSNRRYQPNQRQQEHDGSNENPERLMPLHTRDYVKQA
jgi:hypothetical protein